MRVLVVEDFEVLATAIGSGLRREGTRARRRYE
jgi:hypothetical protein